MPASRSIVFVNRFYYPDHSATAQILTDLAEALAIRGWSVTIVASRLRYDAPTSRLAPVEQHRGVTIRRVATTRFGRGWLPGRMIDYISFYGSALVALLGLLDRGTIVVAKTDPPLLSVVAMVAARLRGAQHVNWLQDLYPEVAVELGIEALRGVMGAPLRWLRNVSLRAAALNIAIGTRMSERLVAEGVPPDWVRVMPNWCDDSAIRPIPRGEALLRTEWNLRDTFVVGYSGNLGRAHEPDTLLGAAALLRHRTDIVFLMIGSGHESERLAKRVAAEGLAGQFQFRPYQPRDLLDQSLAVADVHWLSLRPSLEGLIVPSKFYGIAAAGRPVIAITDADGEIARIVEREKCGLVIEPGDSVALARAIEALHADHAVVAVMGERARALVERDYGRKVSLERWAAVLEHVADGASRESVGSAEVHRP